VISNWTIHIQPQTPSKPAMGMPCKGCDTSLDVAIRPQSDRQSAK
jgi:hypothetical protein